MAWKIEYKDRHPLYHSWDWMKRMSKKHEMSDEWKKDFFRFVSDMGERPSPEHRIIRKDKDKGYCKENCEWRKNMASKTDSVLYQRIWRKHNPNKSKSHELKKSHGITFETYSKMVEKQEGLCAICGKTEKYCGSLAVDHDHKSNKIRGLLCSNCNRALGQFMDSTTNLKNAVTYLESYNLTRGQETAL